MGKIGGRREEPTGSRDNLEVLNMSVLPYLTLTNKHRMRVT